MKPSSLVRWFGIAGAAALSMVGTASAADVQVMISAGFYRVYSELGPAFERASGHHLITTRGPSMGDSPEAIPTRLARGEVADVVILDGGAADELGRRGLVRADSKVEFARSLIGMVVRAGAAKPDIGSIEALGARYWPQSPSRIRTVVAALICRQRCFPSSASQTRSRARVERCEGLRRANRWPNLSRVARRKSASNRSAS
jgi:hypothetical protein